MSLRLRLPLGVPFGLRFVVRRGILMREEGLDPQQDLQRIDRFVESTRTAIFVREADNLLLIRPDKTLAVNRSALLILQTLYDRRGDKAASVLPPLARRLGIEPDRLIHDATRLIEAVGNLLNEDYSTSDVVRMGPFDRDIVKFPTLSEIALTYGCQNRCSFCYASSPHREDRAPAMTTSEVKRVMDKIIGQAHVPSLSFTGGEATLRPDLEELVAYGRELGFRVNLISNGLRLADRAYAQRLVSAGLDSAQISLEAGRSDLHDRIVGRRGAFEKTVAAVGNLRELGVHVHTNSTLCPENLDHAPDLIRFVARDLELRTMSMNMVIRTGEARRSDRERLTYTAVAQRLPSLVEVARSEGVRFVWYSPIPYCIFNPVLHDLGAKSCACVDGILSVDPGGRVLPCSSFEQGIGSLLEHDYDAILGSRAGRYWKGKAFVPPVCHGCADVDVCAGACPLYWDEAGSFGEIPRPGSDDADLWSRWRHERSRGGSFGVKPPRPEQGAAVWVD